ncbi:IQ domain-containing protein K isoform X1 [Monodelphis domestica]|uniref:IQ motif containing K n=1 Tax=Monodelphis domestica TaxID=13616 RepID=A0A5F8G3P2_MONDO|nr:IQ domain-containing protein K isoform X1 [Monodelphis domestica]
MAGKASRKEKPAVSQQGNVNTPERDVAESGVAATRAVSGRAVSLGAIQETLPTSSPISPLPLSSPGAVQSVEGTGVTEAATSLKTPSEPEKNLWEQICEEYEAEQPPFPEGYKVKQQPVITVSSPLESTVFPGLSPEHFFQVTPNYAIVQDIPCMMPEAPEVLDPKTCPPREYLENFIFPVLLPGMANLLHQAKIEKCFERKKTKFVACDFLTEWLYNQNPKRIDEPFTEFFSIPFVANRLKIQAERWNVLFMEWCYHWNEEYLYPRPPIPLSLLLSEEEATLIIQAFWRGYLVRCDPEIQELRQWQKQLREDSHIRQRVKEFWAKQEKKVKCKLEDEEEPPYPSPEANTTTQSK